MKLLILSALVSSVNIYKREDTSAQSIKEKKPGVAFWEQQGVDAIISAKENRPFNYTNYVDANMNPDGPKLMQDYKQVGVYLFVCILGMVIGLVGSILTCCCCVLKEPMSSGESTRAKKISSAVLTSISLIATLFLCAMIIGSLTDLSSGVNDSTASASTVLTSASTMVDNAKSSISAGFKNFTIDFVPSVNITEGNVTKLIDDIDAATTADGLYMDMVLNNTRSSVNYGKTNVGKTKDGATALSGNITAIQTHFGYSMGNLTALDDMQNYTSPAAESYQVIQKLFQSFVNKTFSSSIDTQAVNDLKNKPNPFAVTIPATNIGDSIHNKIKELKLKSTDTFTTIRSTLSLALAAIKGQLNTTNFDSLDVSALNQVSNTLNAQKAVVGSSVTYLNMGIYTWLGISFVCLILAGLTIAFKNPRIAMCGLSCVMILTIVAFVLSFICYLLAFVVGEGCSALTSTADSGIQKYTSAGITVQELCLNNKTLLQVFQNDTVANILPSGFNTSMFNVSLIVKSKIKAQNLNMNSLDASFSTSAFDSNEFNSLFTDVHAINTTGLDASISINGDIDSSVLGLLDNATIALNTANALTVGAFNHYEGNNTDHVVHYKGKVSLNQNGINTVKSDANHIGISKNYTIVNSKLVLLALNYSLGNISLAEQNLPKMQNLLNTSITHATTETKKLFNSLIDRIGDLIIAQIEESVKGVTCFEVAEGFQALTNSVCSVSVYYKLM